MDESPARKKASGSITTNASMREVIEGIMEETGATTGAEVVRNALRVYRLVVAAQRSGRFLVARDAEGTDLYTIVA